MASSPRSDASEPEPQEGVTEGPTPTSPFANPPSFDKRPKLSIPLLLFNDADTLLYIDSVPESQPRTIALSPTIPHRVHSEKLLATGSAYFERLFKPRYQTRIRRQRGYADKLPDGIRYLVDLTPAILDEDAVIALTEVSCPMAIRTWASYKDLWQLPRSCVGGEDELEVVENREPMNLSEPLVVHDEEENSEEDNQEEGNNSPRSPWHGTAETSRAFRTGLPMEYSAARHREGIEHVLHVLEGLSIALDTPCKLWTFFAVAKLYDVATVSSISGYIISWFYERHNTRFIEIHPEIAYRIACGIRSTTLCRDAFVGLVSDEALLYLVRSASLAPIGIWKSSFISRMKDALDDTEVQRIEYASKAFADDIIKHFIHLAGEEMSWLADVPEFTKIPRHASDYPEDAETAHLLIKSLKEVIRNVIFRILSNTRDPLRSCDAVPPDHPKPYYRAFHQGSMLIRLMGSGFWSGLVSCNSYFSDDRPRMLNITKEHPSIADLGYGLLAFQGQENASLSGVPKATLVSQVQEFNELVERRTRQAQISMERAIRARNSEREQRLNLAVNLRRRLQLDDESPFFPMDTALPERPANRTTASLPLSQEPFKDSAFTTNTPHIFASNEVQPSGPENVHAFDFQVFVASVTAYISSYSRSLLYTYDEQQFQKKVTDLLTCLTDNEWQYLPLWAGGNDDGTGGVFADQEIPIVNTGGFSAPGPAVHTGSTASTDDSFSEINPSDSQSTVQGASHHATYSHASEIMSLDSFEEVGALKGPNVSGTQDPSTSLIDHDLGLSSKSGVEDDFDVQSTGASTVVMGSPNLSGFSDDDVDMVASDDDFDFVEGMNQKD